MIVTVSYFYQVRNLQRNHVPFSTAVWDPKWYHDNQESSHIFFDKRGVVNGLRAPMLTPPKWLHNACRGVENCPKGGYTPDCGFLVGYSDYIHTLSFNDVLLWLYNACKKIELRSDFGGKEAVCVLLVYEKPDNLCSERGVLQKWFRENGKYLPEWEDAYG